MMKSFMLTVLTLLSAISFAQKIKLLEGDLKPLKGQSSIRTEFVYDDMIIGKDQSEKNYVAEKKAKLDEKEPGKGTAWEKAWIADRHERFEPEFRNLFAKYASVTTVDEKAPYTMIFKTRRTEPGWNAGVMRMPAFIDGEAWIVESANRANVIAKISLLKAPGTQAWGGDFETGARLQEAYAKAGKELGVFIKSKAKK
jgi:hypothetical protein